MSEEYKNNGTKRRGTSDEAVHLKTGKDWQEWFNILDRAGAQGMSHKEIVTYLEQNYNVPPWWRQQVTVVYEQERGLRKIHEMPDGYQISRSKTINVSVTDLYNSWYEEEQRNQWLGDSPFHIRSARAEKSLRLVWDKPPGTVEVNFYAKGIDKSQVTVQHSKLESSQLADEMKVYWAQVLDRLKVYMEDNH